MGEPRSRALRLFVVGVFVLILSACASTGGGGTRERGAPITVQVINDLIPPRMVTVSVRPANGGSRRVLGSVPPSQSGSFRYRLGVTGQEYVFTSTDPDGKETTSRSVPLDLEDVVVWSLRSNQLELRMTS